MRLEATDLGGARGGRRVFAGARFAFDAGAIVALEGPNGSGKSTLLRVLAGLTPIEAGAVAITDADGAADLADDRDAFQSRVLYAGHLDAVKPALTARENLAFWARYYGQVGADLDAALEKFDLTAIADAPAARMSAGQKRRLGLARLAAIDRPLWLLDEPTTSMDAASVARFAELVGSRAASGGVVIAATHAPLGLAPTERLDMRAFAPGEETGGENVFLEGDWT